MNFRYNKEELEKNYEEAIKNKALKELIIHIGLTKEEAMTKITKLEDTLKEIANCKNCKGLYTCKNAYLGHVSVLKKENNKRYGFGCKNI